MRFQLNDCDIGIKVEGTDYTFDHVNSVTIDDPRRNQLTRGANSNNKLGLVYTDGLKEPATITVPILNMSAALKGVLDTLFEGKGRCDFYVISRSDGSKKMAKNAILSNRPQQLTLDESAESMEVSLEFKSFDLSEDHKS